MSTFDHVLPSLLNITISLSVHIEYIFICLYQQDFLCLSLNSIRLLHRITSGKLRATDKVDHNVSLWAELGFVFVLVIRCDWKSIEYHAIEPAKELITENFPLNFQKYRALI